MLLHVRENLQKSAYSPACFPRISKIRLMFSVLCAVCEYLDKYISENIPKELVCILVFFLHWVCGIVVSMPGP